MIRQCDANYSHAERPRVGRCVDVAAKRAASNGRAVDGGPYVYSCPTHADRNPWEQWESVPPEAES